MPATCVSCGANFVPNQPNEVTCNDCNRLARCKSQTALLKCAERALIFLGQQIGLTFETDQLDCQRTWRKHFKGQTHHHLTQRYLSIPSLLATCHQRAECCESTSAMEIKKITSAPRSPSTARAGVENYIKMVLNELDVVFLDSSAYKHMAGCCIYGVTSTGEYASPIGTMQGYVKSISVLRGLPILRTTATLVHEFVHAWIHLKRGTIQGVLNSNWFQSHSSIEAANEEGLCNAVAVAFHQYTLDSFKVLRPSNHSTKSLVEYWMRQLLSPENPYSSQARQALARVPNIGWNRLLLRMVARGSLIGSLKY